MNLLDENTNVRVRVILFAHKVRNLKHVLHLQLEVIEILLLLVSLSLHKCAKLLQPVHFLVDSADFSIPHFERALHALQLICKARDSFCVCINIALKIPLLLFHVFFDLFALSLKCFISFDEVLLGRVLVFALPFLQLNGFAVRALCIEDKSFSYALLKEDNSLACLASKSRVW